MSTSANDQLRGRISKAAEILKIEESKVEEVLQKIGVEVDEAELAIRLLDASTTSETDIINVFLKALDVNGVSVRVTAAAKILKGGDPFNQPAAAKVDVGSNEGMTRKLLTSLERNSRNIKGMGDGDLLRLFIEEKDERVLYELDARAKHRPFVVLERNSENINFEATLELLKLARKRPTPETVPLEEGLIAQVYKVTDLNPEDRIVETCPFCEGYLFRGHCSKCSVVFPAEIDEEVRAFVKLAVDKGCFKVDSLADKRQVLDSAAKGLDDLYRLFPNVVKEFEEKRRLGTLPKLMKQIELSGGEALHPFFVGNRTI